MAIYPKSFNTKDTLSPGGRGEIFQTSLPGYRDGADRINRTNNTLNTNAHDVPNIKYELDRRLPALFKYGFAYGYNQIVIPKGRLVAADKYMDLYSLEMMKGYRPNEDGTGAYTNQAFNSLTLANGGAPVKLRTSDDKYPGVAYVSLAVQGEAVNQAGKEWAPVVGYANAYTSDTYRPFMRSGPLAQLTAADYEVSTTSGKIIDEDGDTLENVRPGNVPVGVMFRNEYTRDDDAYNGMTPGAVLTDCMLELPWFYFKDKAEQNPWGSAYGNLFPGALVKSDENGRFIVSPLSYAETLCANNLVTTYTLLEDEPEDWATNYTGYFTRTGTDPLFVYAAVEGVTAPAFAVDTYFSGVTVDTIMGLAEYELERQQVVGQVYAVNRNLLPEGAARWATWALSDRRNFDKFSPDMYRSTNRAGEDSIAGSAYNINGEYPGYPYEPSYGYSDLNMMKNRPYDTRMNDEYQYNNLGVPGLTDGQNAVNRVYPPQDVGKLYLDASAPGYNDIFLRVSEVDVNTLMIQADEGAVTAVTKGATVPAQITAGDPSVFLAVKYVDNTQGVVVLSVTNKTAADAYMAAKTDKFVNLQLRFKKRGLSGVPTFLDWDGCLGSVKILLTI